MSLSNSDPIPIIDLFAGPGGLGEGFSAWPRGKKKRFKIALSIENNDSAHKTLTLRAFFRQFPEGGVPNEYYQYLRGEIDRENLFGVFPMEAEAARNEAQCLKLGEDDVSTLIGPRIKGAKHWVLIGGPPCQAYSLVGRSRRLGGLVHAKSETTEEFETRKSAHLAQFETDEKHQLYREYLKIIGDHWPSVFVMENVKGILSAKLNGKLIFPKILADLQNPSVALQKTGKSYRYTIRSLTLPIAGDPPNKLSPADFLIHSESYGIPQARHRVILVGIREDVPNDSFAVLSRAKTRTVKETISDLPKLTPGISKERDLSLVTALRSLKDQQWWREVNSDPALSKVSDCIERVLIRISAKPNRGSAFVQTGPARSDPWFTDPQLNGVCNHETRSHITSDLWRYVFCASYAQENSDKAPQLRDFPRGLLPAHKNVEEAISGKKFGDRFRVQVA